MTLKAKPLPHHSAVARLQAGLKFLRGASLQVVRVGLGAGWLLSLGAGMTQAQAQNSPSVVAKPAASSSGPSWQQLNAEQKQALAPLQGIWHEVSLEQKRKWMVMAKNFDQMSADEQAKLQRRMKGWAALPRQDRIEARQNFLATQNLPAEVKTQHWLTYQQLSPEEKKKLAAQAAAKAPGVSVGKPLQTEKLAPVPVVNHASDTSSKPGYKLAVPINAVDAKTLLPTTAQTTEPETSTN